MILQVNLRTYERFLALLAGHGVRGKLSVMLGQQIRDLHLVLVTSGAALYNGQLFTGYLELSLAVRTRLYRAIL
ncbi:MAG: hypothetical protein ACK55Z_27970 [bacterium]